MSPCMYSCVYNIVPHTPYVKQVCGWRGGSVDENKHQTRQDVFFTPVLAPPAVNATTESKRRDQEEVDL